MEFCEKIQTLRKNKNLTQEQLAAALYVSRTAVSKWEQGKGYPGIDSLKNLADFFDVTVDELLSSEQVVLIAKRNDEEKAEKAKTSVFAAADVLTALMLFLPVFGVSFGGEVKAVSIINLLFILKQTKLLYYAFFALVSATTIYGIIEFCFIKAQNQTAFKTMRIASLGITVATLLLFMLSRQPYASVFIFCALICKSITVLKMQKTR